MTFYLIVSSLINEIKLCLLLILNLCGQISCGHWEFFCHFFLHFLSLHLISYPDVIFDAASRALDW